MATRILQPAALAFAGILAALPAQAIVHLNPNPAVYEVAPEPAPGEEALPWNNIGKMVNASGGQISGTVVSVSGKYCLTADHVTMRSHVTFDGSNLYAVDTSFTPVTFELYEENDPRYQKPDLKLFKLVENPMLPTLPIINTAPRTYRSLYIIGWGQGKSPSQSAPIVSGSDYTWNWGGSTVKRWGTNSQVGVADITPVNLVAPNGTVTTYNYTYLGIRTRLNSASTLASEAGIGDYDSGAAAFIYLNNKWQLAGIATYASFNTGTKASRFGTNNTTRDSNNWVALQPLRSRIEALLPSPSPYEEWCALHGLTGANAAINADPDSDGIANLSEFAYGSNPVAHDGQVAPALVRKPGGGLVFRYQLSKTADGIDISVLHSADVVNWSPAPGTPAVVEDTPDYAVYELEVFPAANAERFYTVNVSLED